MKQGCILGKLSEIHTYLYKFIVRKIKEENIPILQNHMPLFFILPEDGSAMIFNEISNIWDISKSSLSDIINKYETQGLIKKTICEEDKRSVYVSLEPPGFVIKQKLSQMESEFLDAMLDSFDSDKKQFFQETVDEALISIKKHL